ncbi:hypothetical protein PAPYR_8923 [Paratrimastix pyriformis]|uniref:F-box domain-containing protein n=1 Tax=Paratrimastix pyriformis TaxID=342808 RepID=A0ABQ8U9N0_9EUKA|nr:hypothetical protein PAPYR_8923 [Paratrimastix pyriformis]
MMMEIISRLPLELYLLVIEASEYPTITYIQLISLSHAIRMTVNGAVHDLSFDDSDPALPTVSAEALSALARSCKNLVKMSLVDQRIPFFEHDSPAITAWVQTTFGGLHSLTYLRLPLGPLVLALLEAGHLADLKELWLDRSRTRLVDSALLVALGRFCPNLQALHILGYTNQDTSTFDYTALYPLASTLRQLSIPELPVTSSLGNLLVRCESLEKLAIPRCPPALRHLCSRLVRLATRLEGQSLAKLADLGICRLAEFDLMTTESPALPRLLAANQDTLRSVALRIQGISNCRFFATPDESPPTSEQALLPPALLARLESLSLAHLGTYRHPISIASNQLRRLVLREVHLGSLSSLTLDCPSLTTLELPQFRSCAEPYALTMHCPSLDRLRAPWSWSLLPTATGWADALLDQLRAGSPRLRQLTEFWAGRSGMCDELLAGCCRLTRLDIRLASAQFVGGQQPSVLRLPGSLERLEITFLGSDDDNTPPTNLRLEGAGLRVLRLRGDDIGVARDTPRARLTLCCPVLANLQLEWNELASLTMESPHPVPLVFLRDSGGALNEACLLSLLEEHGAHLRHVTLKTPAPPLAWPRRSASLGRLPQLACLTLGTYPADLVLTCPPLRRLTIGGPFSVTAASSRRPVLCALTLNCPLLEELQAPFEVVLSRFEIGNSNLLRIGGQIDRTWRGQLASRFPGASLEKATGDDAWLADRPGGFSIF